MAGIDDNFFGDWEASNPSPRTFISKFFNEDNNSRPFPDLRDNGHQDCMESVKQKTAVEEVDKRGLASSSDILLEPAQFNIFQSSSRGALNERMSSRAGFGALSVNTSRYATENVMCSPSTENVISLPSDKRSSCLLLSQGVSPTLLLESPVFLSNSMAEPSPTTGKFPFGCSKDCNHASSSVFPEPDKSRVQKIEDGCAEAFTFPPLGSSHAENEADLSTDQQRSLTNMDAFHQQNMKNPAGFLEAYKREESDADITADQKADFFLANQSSSPDEHQNGETDPKGELSPLSVLSPEEDGYNWRKYGQKHVKGSEFPRSYYKCTSPNCPVKKKVERSLEGYVTEIIYKGAHNHQKPPPNRRSCLPSQHSFNDTQMDSSDYPVLQSNFDGKLSLPSVQDGSGGTEWWGDGAEAVPSETVAVFGPSNSMQTQDGSPYDGSEALDLSSAMSNDEEEDRATHGSFSVGCDADGEEMECKRRKHEPCPVDTSVASRAMREPRIVVQTTSEVDILDDGYRWRKYGQKVVKGNPNPRSYYKCTHQGCSVRKHVERASHDLKSVITTYEGKHNHDVPSAKGSNHQSSSSSNSATPSSQQPLGLKQIAEPAKSSFMQFEGHVPINPFCLPGRDPQLGPAPGIAFGIGHQGLAGGYIAGLGPMGLLNMPVFAPVHPYMEHPQLVNNGGFIVPKGEPK